MFRIDVLVARNAFTGDTVFQVAIHTAGGQKADVDSLADKIRICENTVTNLRRCGR